MLMPDVTDQQKAREYADDWKRNWEHCRGSHTALVAAFADAIRAMGG